MAALGTSLPSSQAEALATTEVPQDRGPPEKSQLYPTTEQASLSQRPLLSKG